MPYALNDKIRELTPYEPISGAFQIRLDANESYLSLPEPVLAEIRARLEKLDFNRYPDPIGGELCRAFAGYYGIDPKFVTAGNGSDELISILANAFLMKGDAMLTVAPDFSMYQFYASISEIDCVVLDKGPELSIDVDELIRKAVETGAKMILFSNPCNPTSLGLSRKQVRKLIRSVDSLVVLDEAYMDFWDQSLLSEVEDYENLIILRTSSKAIGCAAIRLGFAVANERLSNALRAVKSPYNVNSFTQMAGTVLFQHKELLERARRQIICQRESLYDALLSVQKEFPGKYKLWKPETNFVFIKPEVPEDARRIFEFLLKNQIAIRCMGNYLRITAGSPEENAELIKLWRLWFAEEEKNHDNG